MTKQTITLALTASVVAVALVYSIASRRNVPGEETETKKATRVKEGFRDVTKESGIDFRMHFLPEEQGEKFKINLYDHGSGVVVGDYNGDGHDDIYFLNQLGANGLFRNRGNGTFENVTDEAGVGLSDRVCVGATFSDYDNDGDQDLYVTSTRGGNVLFQNQGGGKFKDVTKHAGLSLVAHSQTAVFADFDDDGFLDLFVTNTAKWTNDTLNKKRGYFPGVPWKQLFKSPKEFNVFYRNNGDGTFRDLTKQAGLQGKGWGGDVAVLDFDDDGDLDLVVTNMFGQSQLYRNDKGNKFVDVTDEVLRVTSWGAIGSMVFDFNNDGRLDLCMADMHSDMWMPPGASQDMIDMITRNDTRKYQYVTGPSVEFSKSNMRLEEEIATQFNIQYKKVLFGNSLHKNVGGGKFEEVSDEVGLETFWPWGIAAGDFNNDGFIDVFFPSGMGYPFFAWRNYLMMNSGKGTFRDKARKWGAHPPVEGELLNQAFASIRLPRSSRCAATADFDGDGRLDLVVNNFNHEPYFYMNEFPKQPYVAFKLTGTKSNRDAIGAVLKLRFGTETLVRQVTPAGGYLSQSTKTLHFGLGKRTQIDDATIRWPSGISQRIQVPDLNKTYHIRESEE